MRPDLSSVLAMLLFAAGLAFNALNAEAAAPVNDRCAGAILISSNGPFPYFTAPVDISEATLVNDPGVPSCQSDVSRSVWYVFRPVVTDVYRFSTCGESGATN